MAWQTLKSRRLVHSEVGSIDYKVFLSDITAAELNDQDVMNGIHNCREYVEFFSIPKFIELCKYTDMASLGLPDADKAYREACIAPSPKSEHKWSHPAVYHAGAATGWHEMASLPTDKMIKLYRYNYEIMVKRVKAGESLEIEVPKALPEKVPVFLSEEEGGKRMAGILSMFNKGE